jgi:hypothetical protein
METRTKADGTKPAPNTMRQRFSDDLDKLIKSYLKKNSRESLSKMEPNRLNSIRLAKTDLVLAIFRSTISPQDTAYILCQKYTTEIDSACKDDNEQFNIGYSAFVLAVYNLYLEVTHQNSA